MNEERVLVCHLRSARKKARDLAIQEALALLSDCGAIALAGGPLSEQGGVFWLQLPARDLPEAQALLPRLGYTTSVDVLGPPGAVAGEGALLRWRGRYWSLARIYEEDAAAARQAAPDQRSFRARVRGELREIPGYRGDGAALGRRGLPAYDARLLVNLTRARCGQRLFDPFAGVGGVVIEAAAAGALPISSDVEPWLADGLATITHGRHLVADCRMLPLADESIDGVATEAPFDESADEALIASLPELWRVLRRGGRIALMCGERQSGAVARGGEGLGMSLLLRSGIDRKGTACGVFLWEKA